MHTTTPNNAVLTMAAQAIIISIMSAMHRVQQAELCATASVTRATNGVN
jgi:hypothetical protein